MVGTSASVGHRTEAPASRRRPARPAGLPRSGFAITMTVPPPVAALAVTAAVLGTADLMFNRIIGPIVSHVPGLPFGARAAEAMTLGGESLLRTTAVLVVLVALALASALWRHHRLLAVLLIAVSGLELVHAALPATRLDVFSYGLSFAVLVAAVAHAAGVVPRPHGIALGLFALGFVAGVWPHALAAAASWGPALGRPVSPGALRAGAELAFVASVVFFGAAALRREHHSWRTIWLAAAAGLMTAGALLSQPDHAAIAALWATGVTLALPPVLYIAAAACLTVALVEWTRASSTRHLAAGLALLVVAGVAPVVMHHNLTAVLGVTLLAIPPQPDVEI